MSFLLLPFLLATAAPAGGTLAIEIDNVRNDRGRVHIDLCDQAHFLKEDCALSAEAPAHAGTTIVMLHGVPAGTYSIQAFHDENSNSKVDRGLFGIPKEGIGFSRDARISLGPPKWNDAFFVTDGQTQKQAFRMRYLTGATGPRADR